jgi:hypothetical protein
MADKKRSIINDCSHLPYARAQTPIVASTTLQLYANATLEKEVSTFSIRNLIGNPILEWPPRLPATDPRGVATGNNFECWKSARDGKTGISGNYYSLKSEVSQACHSHLEARLRAYFDMCPAVVECRTQYPSWNRGEYLDYFNRGKAFPKNKVMTIDFLLTIRLPGIAHPFYHGVSGKPRDKISDEKNRRRHDREATALWQWGGTHEILDEYSIPDQEYANYLLLKSWLLWTDITSSLKNAEILAAAIKNCNVKGDLDRVLGIVGKRLGHALNRSYALFSIAVFIGYLRLNHAQKLHQKAPLILIA